MDLHFRSLPLPLPLPPIPCSSPPRHQSLHSFPAIRADYLPGAVAPRPPKMSSAPPGPAASSPSPREEEEGGARTRIAYSREFLISVGTSSEACRRLPAGFDASKLSELGLAEAGSRAPLLRWTDACSSSGSGNTGSNPNQADRHPGNQWHSLQSKERDGLLGCGPFAGIPCRAGALALNGQGSGYQLTRRNAGGYQPTRQYETPPVSQKNVCLSNTETSGSFENWDKHRVEEERKSRASFELIKKPQHHTRQEKKKAPDSDKENLGGGIISSLQDPPGKRVAPAKSCKQGGLKISSLSKEDVTKTTPLLPTPTTTPLKPLDFTNGLPQKRLEIQKLNTEDTMESSICAQRFSGGGILGSGHAETIPPKQMVPFSHSKCGPFHRKPSDNPTFLRSSQEGANSDGEGLEFNLPEEDALFSVNDFLSTQNTDDWPTAEWSRAEGLPPEDKVADMNSTFQSLDVRSRFHDQIDPNNLYHLFKTRANAEFPNRNADSMFLPSRPSDRNQQAPLDMPQATHHVGYFPFPQDMKSMQGVPSAPGGPCAGPAAAQHILSHMTMPGSFLPPQGLPICAPHMFYYRSEMAGANSFQMRRCHPGYGETGMMMTGPPGPGVEGYQTWPFGGPVQVESRCRSRQMRH